MPRFGAPKVGTYSHSDPLQPSPVVDDSFVISPKSVLISFAKDKKVFAGFCLSSCLPVCLCTSASAHPAIPATVKMIKDVHGRSNIAHSWAPNLATIRASHVENDEASYVLPVHTTYVFVNTLSTYNNPQVAKLSEHDKANPDTEPRRFFDGQGQGVKNYGAYFSDFSST